MKWTKLILATIGLLTLSVSLSAQTPQPKPASADGSQTRQVIASASGNSIRFSSLGEMIQLRLEVIGSSGEVLFDSTFKSGNVIDWSGSDMTGGPLADGTYLCVVSVKDSSGQITRKRAVASLHNHAAGLRQSDGSLLTAAQAQTAGEASGEDFSVTILERGQPSKTAVIAHDGSAAHLVSGSGGLSISSGDLFANQVLEQLRITAAGNVGIGTSNPQAKLDVAGLIRSSEGIVFPDGSVQFSASRRTFGSASQKPGQFGKNSSSGQEHFETQASGTGTQNRIAKWTDNAGTLGDSVITELTGNIGIGTTNPQSGLDYRSPGAALFTRDLPTNPGNAVSALQVGLSNVGARFTGVGPSFLFFGENTAGAKSFLGRVSGVWETPTAGAESGSIFFQVRANSGDVNALTERMRITASGNVGIGTASPAARLHALGASSGSATPLMILESTGSQIPLSFKINGTEQARIRSDSSGNIILATLNGPSQNIHLRAGDDSTTDMFIHSSTGNVGIGIGGTTPNAKLDVVDSASQIRFGNTSADNGGFLVSTSGTEATLSGGAKWNHGWIPTVPNSGASIVSMENGAIKLFADPAPIIGSTFTPTERMRITSTGRVGIGTTAPANRLHVVGAGTESGGAPGFPAVVAHFTQTTATEDAAVSIDAPSGQDPVLYLAEQGLPKWNIRNDASDGDRFKIRSHNSDGTSDTRLTIEANPIDGTNVGIGITNPTHTLHVENSPLPSTLPAPPAHVVRIRNINANHRCTLGDCTRDPPGSYEWFPSVLLLQLGDVHTPGHENNFITFWNDDGNSVGSIQGNENGGIELGGPGADYAEWLPRLKPAEEIQSGEIVGLHAGRVSKQTRGATQVMAVSTGAIVAGNDPGEKVRNGHELVAFIGQVMVRVRGKVQAGDFIVASGLNDGTGIAVSPECTTSEQFEQVVGRAWESSADTGLKSVRTAVGLVQRDPTVNRLLKSHQQQTAQIAALGARLTALESKFNKKAVSTKTTPSRSRRARVDFGR